jgi:actin-related protein
MYTKPQAWTIQSEYQTDHFSSSRSPIGDIIRTLVIDNGSSTTKAGFDGGDAPMYVFPSIIGRPKSFRPDDPNAAKNFCVSGTACAAASIMNLKYPIEHGIVQDWSDM